MKKMRERYNAEGPRQRLISEIIFNGVIRPRVLHTRRHTCVYAYEHGHVCNYENGVCFAV